MLRKLNNEAFVIPLIVYIFTLFIGGLFYTVFILYVGIPFFEALMPVSDARTFILLLMYALPMIILFGTSTWFIRNSIKRSRWNE